MKHITSLVLLSALSLAMATAAVAQQSLLKAKIPFSFIVGDQELAPGEYTISSPSSNLVEVRSADRLSAASIVALPSHDDAGSGNKLIFTRYGNLYFLHGVQCASSHSMDVTIPTTKREKEMRTLEARLRKAPDVQLAAR
jgi:hypothetical protein